MEEVASKIFQTATHIWESWEHYPSHIRKDARDFHILTRIWFKDDYSFSAESYRMMLVGGLKYLPFVLEFLNGTPTDDKWYPFLNIVVGDYPKVLKGNPTHKEIAEAWKEYCKEKGLVAVENLNDWDKYGINKDGEVIANKVINLLHPLYTKLKEEGTISNQEDLNSFRHICDSVIAELTWKDKVEFFNKDYQADSNAKS